MDLGYLCVWFHILQPEPKQLLGHLCLWWRVKQKDYKKKQQQKLLKFDFLSSCLRNQSATPPVTRPFDYVQVRPLLQPHQLQELRKAPVAEDLTDWDVAVTRGLKEILDVAHELRVGDILVYVYDPSRRPQTAYKKIPLKWRIPKTKHDNSTSALTFYDLVAGFFRFRRRKADLPEYEPGLSSTLYFCMLDFVCFGILYFYKIRQRVRFGFSDCGIWQDTQWCQAHEKMHITKRVFMLTVSAKTMEREPIYCKKRSNIYSSHETKGCCVFFLPLCSGIALVDNKYQLYEAFLRVPLLYV